MDLEEKYGNIRFFKKEKTDVEQYYEERNVQNAPNQTANNFNTATPMNNYSNSASFQFTVEDVFSISGRGTVATGRVSAGELHLGETVTLVKQNGMRRSVRVTGIEMFRKRLDVAREGNNVGLLVSDIDRGEIQRGDILIK